MKQCMELDIPFVDSPECGLRDTDLVVDAIFGTFLDESPLAGSCSCSLIAF
jgi:NAD(P)H-hydrate repair Nnr-like enzyme with NAD(P)H-hydrate epimerase domain